MQPPVEQCAQSYQLIGGESTGPTVPQPHLDLLGRSSVLSQPVAVNFAMSHLSHLELSQGKQLELSRERMEDSEATSSSLHVWLRGNQAATFLSSIHWTLKGQGPRACITILGPRDIEPPLRLERPMHGSQEAGLWGSWSQMRSPVTPPPGACDLDGASKAFALGALAGASCVI